MSIKKTVLKLSTKKIKRDLILNGTAEKALDVMMDVGYSAINTACKYEYVGDILSKSLYSDHIIIKQGVKRLDYILGESKYADIYTIYSSFGEKIYTIDGGLILGKHNFRIKDTYGNILGEIHKAIRSKNEGRKTYNSKQYIKTDYKEVFINIENILKLHITTYYEYGVRKIVTDSKIWSFSVEDNRRKYSINYNSTPIASLTKSAVMPYDQCNDKYVLEYNGDINKLIYIAISVAIDIMFHGND